VHVSDVMAAVEHGLEALLVPGVELEFEGDGADALLRIDRSVLQALLSSLVHLAIEQVRPRGHVRLALELDERDACFIVEDDGAEDPALVAWAEGPYRGRPLICALAHALLERCGGGLEVASANGRSRVLLRVPRAVEAEASEAP
jgi:signal transduction histidine kinase